MSAQNPLHANALSTRAKLMALLLTAIIPLCGLIIYSAFDRYNLLIAASNQQARHMAIVLADRHSAIIDNTRSILQSLANTPALRQGEWQRCNTVLSDFHQYFREHYSTFHVATPSGQVVCSATELTAPINVSDREDFAESLQTDSFVMGKLIKSRATGLVSVAARYPVKDYKHKTIAIITAQVSALQFEIAALNTPIPDGGELLVFNSAREIVLNLGPSPLAAGDTLPENALWEGMKTTFSGVTELAGVDKVKRIYGFSRAPIDRDNWIYVAIGFPVENIHKDVFRHLFQSTATAILIAIFVLSFAWFGVEVFVLRKVRILLDTVTRLRNGDSSARTGMIYGRDELCRIARAVDETAEELERAMNSLREQTVRDPLTSLYNRRFMEETLAREIQTSQRRGWHLGLIMADIDHFKHYNDKYGHDLGDELLKIIANTLLANVRGGDTVCRFGGEEFAIILPGTSIDIAASRAEKIREAIRAISFDYEGVHIDGVTISLGVAIYPSMGTDSHALIRNSDAALYLAKNNGRNMVMIASAAINPDE